MQVVLKSVNDLIELKFLLPDVASEYFDQLSVAIYQFPVVRVLQPVALDVLPESPYHLKARGFFNASQNSGKSW